MEKYMDGLMLHDIILMALGVLLFLVALIGITVYIFKKRSIKNLLFLFPIAIVMIGYSGIRKINFMNNMLAIEKAVQQVQQNPNDTAAINKLEKVVSEVENKVKTPQSKAVLSQAYLLLGEHNAAVNLAEDALVEKPDLVPAREVKAIVELKRDIEQAMDTSGKRTEVINANAEEIRRKINVLEAMPKTSSIRTSTISNAYRALGDTLKANIYADSTKILRKRAFDNPVLKRRVN